MPKDIQQPFAGRKLQQQYELRGSVRPVLDDVIVPVAIVDNLADGVPLSLPRERKAQSLRGADNIQASGVLPSLMGMQVRTPPGNFCRIDRVYLQITFEDADILFRAGLTAHYHDTLVTFDDLEFTAGDDTYQDGRLVTPQDAQKPTTEITAGLTSTAKGLGGASSFYSNPSGPVEGGVLAAPINVAAIEWLPPGGMYLGRNKLEDSLYFQLSPDVKLGAIANGIAVDGATWAVHYTEWFKV